jgi:hypothetical protein
MPRCLIMIIGLMGSSFLGFYPPKRSHVYVGISIFFGINLAPFFLLNDPTEDSCERSGFPLKYSGIRTPCQFNSWEGFFLSRVED